VDDHPSGRSLLGAKTSSRGTLGGNCERLFDKQIEEQNRDNKHLGNEKTGRDKVSFSPRDRKHVCPVGDGVVVAAMLPSLTSWQLGVRRLLIGCCFWDIDKHQVQNVFSLRVFF